MISNTHGINQEEAQQFVSDVIRGWPSDQTFSAADVLRNRPDLNDHRSAVVDLAYEEYCRRNQQGESIDIEEFARQFPTVRGTLLRLVSLDNALDGGLDPQQLSDSIAWPAVGQDFLTFHLLEELGRGVFSRVFLARDLELGDRPVVLKVSWGGGEEAYTLGQLQHPHIVPVNSVRRDPATDLTAISLPYLGRATLFDALSVVFSEGGKPKSGHDLLDAIDLINPSDDSPHPDDKKGRRSKWDGSYVDTVVRLGSQLADALAHSHRLGIYHGDIKPSNILVTGDGQAMLFDFNLSVNALGTSSRFGGTMPYMAPEQLQLFLEQDRPSDQATSPQSELFSLGVTLFEMLCGQHPFGPISSDRLRHDTAAVLVERQQSGPKSLRSLNDNVDPMLAALIESTLAFDAAARPQTCDEFAGSLKQLIVPHQRARRRVVNHPRLSAAMLILIILGGALGSAAWLAIPPRHVRALNAAERQYDADQHESAAQAAALILAERPDCQRARFLRAASLMKLGQYRDARDEFRSLYNQRPVDDRMAYFLAHCVACTGAKVRDLGLIGDAEIQLKDIRQNSVQDPAYFHNLGYCHLKAGHNSEAITALLSAIEMGGTQPRTYILLAEAQRRHILSPPPGSKSGVHLKAAKRHIRSALKSTQLSDSEKADAFMHQGMIDATVLLKLTGNDEAQATRLRDDVLDSLREAVRHGLSDESMSRVTGVNPKLVDDADFQELRNRSQQNPAENRLRWLMAPSFVDDILPTLPCE